MSCCKCPKQASYVVITHNMDGEVEPAWRVCSDHITGWVETGVLISLTRLF